MRKNLSKFAQLSWPFINVAIVMTINWDCSGFITLLMMNICTSVPGFLSSTSYLYHAPKPESQMDLLPVAPIHIHPQSELRPIYFSDVIIPTEDKYVVYMYICDLTSIIMTLVFIQ